MEILRKVKNQYELYPYPRVSPLAWLGRIVQNPQNSFERGCVLTQKDKTTHEDKKIAVFGCGTQEAVGFANSHRKSQIYACDISQRAIALSQLRSKILSLKNIEFYRDDLIEFSKKFPEEFDYVHAFGVLHHLENPEDGFKAVHRALKPEGFARIMVYSTSNRKKISHLQRVLKKLNYSFNTPHFEKGVRSFIKTIPFENPLRLAFELHTEAGNKPGLVDAFLHAHEKAFNLRELLQTVENTGLKIKAWDFSPQILRMLSEVSFLNTTEERIELLESLDQWPSNYTFWVTK